MDTEPTPPRKASKANVAAARDAFANPCPTPKNRGRMLCTMVVDAEEDFNWTKPVFGTNHSVANMRSIDVLQTIANAYGLPPTYLLTYPVLQDAGVVERLARLESDGRCQLGVQLHPWVTPPFDPGQDGANVALSFAGNLPAAVERAKLTTLCDRFEACFGHRPEMYRAGRYGIGPETPRLLEELGFRVDTSIAPRTDFSSQGGPDFTDIGYEPFWFGTRRRLLELPLCREIVGWAGPLAPRTYDVARRRLPAAAKATAVASWTRAAERITMSPEGNRASEMRRLAKALARDGTTPLAISFHSSSLVAGLNPYVGTKNDVHAFYDRISSILSFMRNTLDARFVGLGDLPGLLPEVTQP